MAEVQEIGGVAVLVLVAFLPSIVYAVWVRNLERHGREPWGGLLKAFLWGAIGGVVLAVILSMFLLEGTPPDALPALSLTPLLFAAVIVAPLAEEFAKALGLVWIRDRHPEPEDGLVYGAAAGFGFAATENLLYQFEALLTLGIEGYIVTAILRTISSALLHGSATALVGFAIWRMRVRHGGVGQLIGFYLAAAFLHGLFNLAASTQLLVGLVFSVTLALVVFGWIRKRVRRLDRTLMHAPPA